MIRRRARHLAKRCLERCVVGSGGASLARFLRRGRSVVLLYHNVMPDGTDPAGDASLHLPRAEFGRQLDLLGRTHRVVPLSDLFDEEGGYREGVDAPRAVITFDDGYRGAVTAGARELARREMPATFFVSPGLLGQPGFWWDELAPEGAAGLPDRLREEALERGRGFRDEVHRWAEGRGLRRRRAPDHAGVATEEELAELAGRPGVTLGSHTWSHPNLERLDPVEVETELARPLEWLRARFGEEKVQSWLSLPYGRSAGRVPGIARRVGYVGAVRIRGGLVGPNADAFRIPRVNVPAGLSRDGFVLRTAGL